MHKLKKGILLAGVCIIGLTGLTACESGNVKRGTVADGGSTNLEYRGSVIDNNTLGKAAKIEAVIDSSFYFGAEDEALEEGIYKGMVEALDDPYSKYYTKEEYAKLQEDTSGEYAGIGVTVRQDTDSGAVVVVNILPGAPAEDVDIKPGDYITKIGDYEITTEDDLDYLVTMIRGEVGTDVTLTVYRSSDMKTHDVTITRRQVENRTVEYQMLDDNIGYIRVTQFVGNTGDMFEEALNDLDSQGMKGLIVDLRSNPGGLLNVVVSMCDDILASGKIVYEEDKNGKVISSYEATDDKFLDKPMVVIVNGESASASEVFTGAMKDHGVATIVGENTFGKGIVQSVIPLQDGSAVKLTTAKYFTPNGNDIHKKGIAPDVEVSLPDDYTADDYMGEKDTQFNKAVEVIKEEIK